MPENRQSPIANRQSPIANRQSPIANRQSPIANRIITLFKRGFTFIEILIVVAIIGVLATIAIPEYNDYVIRAKIAEGILAADTCKKAVEEVARIGNKTWPTDPRASVPIDCGNIPNWEDTRGGKMNSTVFGIGVNYSGMIVVHFQIPELGKQNEIYLAPYSDAEGTRRIQPGDFANAISIKAWRCGPNGGKFVQYGIKQKYLPSSCRVPIPYDY